jgi:hypothetical protein
MLRNTSRTAAAPGWAWPPTTQPTVDLFRLRKAVLYADIIEAGGISADAVDGFTTGQWNPLALIAKGKPPSPETCAVIRHLLHQRAQWRELVAREKGQPHAS